MIKITKGTEPTILKQNATVWTNDILNTIVQGNIPTEAQKTRYNCDEVKDALYAETYEKCAYCESKMGSVSYAHIEHIFPKSKDWTKAFDWNNLTMACQVCNMSKGDFQTTMQNFVNPYIDDPDDHFSFAIQTQVRDKTVQGEQTIIICQLNRPKLREAKADRLHGFTSDLDCFKGKLSKFPDQATRDSIWQGHKQTLTADSVEFAAMKREALKHFP